MAIQSRTHMILGFIAGVLLTLGFKDLYPDLERRFRRRWTKRTIQTPHSIESENHVQVKDSLNGWKGPGETTVLKTQEPRGIVEGLEGCIGNTPLFRIKSLSDETGCEILAKAEFLNGCGGSPKDRVALKIIDMAEKQGYLTPYSGDIIYEGTVGSTGISLSTLCRAKGYQAHICMPSDQATEKSDLLLKLGAVVERVPPASIIDPMHFVNRARALALQHTRDQNRPGKGFFADQFETEANWRAHFEGTGPEIFDQCGGKVDAFVAGAGTGGTIAGVAKFLKSKDPGVKIILADPQGSGLYNRIKYGVMFDPREKDGTRRRHQVDSIVEGIGVNRVTANFEVGRELIDDAIKVSDEQALKMARWLVEKDGIFIGSSSAVNCKSPLRLILRRVLTAQGVAAVEYAKSIGPGHRIVTILCDSGTRHLSKFWTLAGNVEETNTSLSEIVSSSTLE